MDKLQSQIFLQFSQLMFTVENIFKDPFEIQEFQETIRKVTQYAFFLSKFSEICIYFVKLSNSVRKYNHQTCTPYLHFLIMCIYLYPEIQMLGSKYEYK